MGVATRIVTLCAACALVISGCSTFWGEITNSVLGDWVQSNGSKTQWEWLTFNWDKTYEQDLYSSAQADPVVTYGKYSDDKSGSSLTLSPDSSQGASITYIYTVSNNGNNLSLTNTNGSVLTFGRPSY